MNSGNFHCQSGVRAARVTLAEGFPCGEASCMVEVWPPDNSSAARPCGPTVEEKPCVAGWRHPRSFCEVKELNLLLPGMTSFHALVSPELSFCHLVESPCLIWHGFCRSPGYGLLSSFANIYIFKKRNSFLFLWIAWIFKIWVVVWTARFEISSHLRVCDFTSLTSFQMLIIESAIMLDN